MAITGVKVGSLDIQFGADFDQAKANQLVQSLQQVIAAVNRVANAAATPPAPGVAVHELADQSGLGVDHTVAGLVAGQVLVATAPTAAHFAFLEFAQLAQVDPNTFASPQQGDIIAFINGYWSAVSNSESLGLVNPGTDAVVMWDTTANAGAGGLAWALPGLGILITSGRIAVDASQLTHGQLLGLLADDHPQYALIGAVNTWTQAQTFLAGVVTAGITVDGDVEQVGAWPEQRVANTDDDPDAWRLHVETGQEMWAACNDDGSDAENWWYVQRDDDVVDTVGVSASYFRFNGTDVLVGELGAGARYLSVTVAGQVVVVPTTLAVASGAAGVISVDIASPAGTLSTAGGPITTFGTLDVDLPVMGLVTPGAYTNCNITVDAYGRITLIANGSGGGGSGTVTSVGLTVNATYLTIGGTASPITAAGTFTLDLSAGAQAALALAATALQPIAGLGGSYTNTNLTLNASGQITAAANGTASASPYNLVPEDHTGTPTFVENDECELSAGTNVDTAGTRFPSAVPWVWGNQGGSTAKYTGDGSLILAPPADGVLHGVYQPASGVFKRRARLYLRNPAASAGDFAGIFAYNSGNGHIIAFGPFLTSGPTATLAILRWSAFGTFNSVGYNAMPLWFNALALIEPAWYEVRSDGTTLTYAFSPSGVEGSFFDLTTETIAAFLAGVDNAGVCADSNSTPASSVVVDLWRKY